eukprot:3735951-Amphidinium_carterae.1
MPSMRDKLLQVSFHDVPVGSMLLLVSGVEGDFNSELELQEILDDKAGFATTDQFAGLALAATHPLDGPIGL